MIDAEITRFIREEIKRQMDVILSGVSGENDTIVNEDIQSMYPGMPTILARPVMHPYGFVSRAPQGTLQVVGKQGEHIGNRIVIGHRDGKRPIDLESGESKIYTPAGPALYAKEDGGVDLGIDPTHPVGLADYITSRIKAIEDKLNGFISTYGTHTHPVTSAPGVSGPTTSVVTPLVPDTKDLGSAKVNVPT